MFFTRLRLNPRRRHTGRLIDSPHRIHAAVLAGFAEELGGQGGPGRPLWRLDEGRHAHLLYVVSGDKPDFRHISEDCCWENDPKNGTTDYDAFLDRLAPGQQWRFRYTGNPVRAISAADRSIRSKRVPLVKEEDRLTWFIKLLERHGAEPAPLEPPGAPHVELLGGQLRRFRGSSERIDVTQAHFSGGLIVTDAARFREALTQGMGRKKAYGCGLLTIG